MKSIADITLPFHLLEADGDFDGTEPAHTRLSSTLTINGQHFHIECVEIYPDVGIPKTVNPVLQRDVDRLCDLLGDAPTSMEINGRAYIVYIMPFAT